MSRSIPDEAQVLQWVDSLKNWGRWGPEDQLGCLNLIGPEQRKRAVGLVTDGCPSVALAPSPPKWQQTPPTRCSAS